MDWPAYRGDPKRNQFVAVAQINAGEFGHETWNWPKGETFGGANAWGGVTIDEQRGWVFAATGSATDDFLWGLPKGK